MNLDVQKWQIAAMLLTGALAAVGLVYALFHSVARRRHTARLIAAARVRAGFLPDEVPTVRSGLTNLGGLEGDTTTRAALGDAEGAADEAVVDEQPRIRIRYVDARTRKVEATLQVQHLDVARRIVIGYCDMPADVRQIPLRDILAARLADTGRRFSVDTWVDAVRVARRRRGIAI